MESSVSTTDSQNFLSSLAHAATLSVSCARVWAMPFIVSLKGKSGETAAKVRKVSEISLKSNSMLSGKTVCSASSTMRLPPTVSVLTSPASDRSLQKAESP